MVHKFSSKYIVLGMVFDSLGSLVGGDLLDQTVVPDFV